MMYAYAALAALQVVGGFQSADIIRQNGDLQSEINNWNAQFADQQAFNEIAAGQGTAARYQEVVDKTVAAERGKYAGEGVAIGYGTAASKDANNHVAGLMNVLQIQKQARNAALGYQTQGINMRLSGAMTQLNAGLQAGAAQFKGLEQGVGTFVAGYERSLSTGKGRDSQNGTNDQAWNASSIDMNVSSDGSGFTPPPKLYDNGFGWYPRGHGDSPGFFGTGPSEYPYSGALGNYSFTSESQ